MWSVGVCMNVYDEKTMFNELEKVDRGFILRRIGVHEGFLDS